MSSIIETVVGVTLVFSLVLGGLFVLMYAAVSWQCSIYQEVTGIETKVAAGSCYLNVDGKWLMWEEYKLRNATRGAE